MTELTRRVGVLEADMREVKASLGRLEPLLVRIDEQQAGMKDAIAHLATAHLATWGQ